MSSNTQREYINQMLQEADTLHQETNEGQMEKTDETARRAESDEEVIDLGESFNFDGFQVVRREFFAHIYEPSVTFNNCKFYVNTACIQKFPDTDNVQVLVNKDTKILAIMPCPANARDSFAWCTLSKGKRKPKQITCKLFFAKVFSMMGWNPDTGTKFLAS